MIGVQVPRVESVPEHDDATLGDSALAFLSALGVELDEWQKRILLVSLCRNGSRWSASRVCMSVPRQSGKSLLAIARELYALFSLPPGSLIIHSAHLYPTASESFFTVRNILEAHPALFKATDNRPGVEYIHDWQGDRSVKMTNGTRLQFAARSRGQGRGFSCDLLILDEVQELSSDTWADIMPTVSARPNPQIWLMGTPPSAKMNGEVFASLRDAGIRGDDPRLYFAEFSAERTDDPAKVETWAKALPALGGRIQVATVEDEYSSMKDRMLDQFQRERLGIWDDNPFGVFDPARWQTLATDDPPMEGLKAFAVDMNPDRSQVTIGAAVKPAEGVPHVEVVHTENIGSHGTAWVIDWLVERWPDTAAVVIDGQSPAASLVPELVNRKVKVMVTSGGDMAKACGRFYDAYIQAGITHYDQPTLNDGVRNAKRRDTGTGGAFAWDRKAPDTDITGLVAVTLALWGVETTKRRPGRKARVMF